MDSLVVTVHSSSPRGTLMLELPGEVQLRILLPKLIRVLGLPSADDGGSYQLIHQTGRRVVHEAETLLGAGVVTGDELLVVSAAAQAQSAQEEITSSPGAGPAPGEGAPTDPVVMGQAAAADSPPDPTHQSSPGFQREGTRECESLNPAHDRTRGRTVAFWSGPAGGTGRTMLALALAAHAAERGADTGLLALSEPGLSAYLHLPRVPNAATFFDTGNLSAAGQAVSWESEAGEAALQVVLGPARPW
ncbi:MAG: EsaB/YukD family protein, partial [Anaerolineae bacterium]